MKRGIDVKQRIDTIIQAGILIALIFLVVGVYQMNGWFEEINFQLGRIHGRLHEMIDFI